MYTAVSQVPRPHGHQCLSEPDLRVDADAKSRSPLTDQQPFGVLVPLLLAAHLLRHALVQYHAVRERLDSPRRSSAHIDSIRGLVDRADVPDGHHSSGIVSARDGIGERDDSAHSTDEEFGEAAGEKPAFRVRWALVGEDETRALQGLDVRFEVGKRTGQDSRCYGYAEHRHPAQLAHASADVVQAETEPGGGDYL